jgi:hypothetical protein
MPLERCGLWATFGQSTSRVNRKISTFAAVGIIVGLLAAFSCWAYFGDTSIRQDRHMRLARESLPGVSNAVYSHPEFRDISIGIGTGAGGCLLVVGLVKSEKEQLELQGVIGATKPTVPVLYRLKVLGTPSHDNL